MALFIISHYIFHKGKLLTNGILIFLHGNLAVFLKKIFPFYRCSGSAGWSYRYIVPSRIRNREVVSIVIVILIKFVCQSIVLLTLHYNQFHS